MWKVVACMLFCIVLTRGKGSGEGGNGAGISFARYLLHAGSQGILILANTRVRLVTWAMDAPWLPLARSKGADSCRRVLLLL